MAEKEQEKRREIGRYTVLEHTARRLMAEAQGCPLITVGVTGAVFVVIATLIAPWRGGVRLFIVAVMAAVLAIISLLVVYSVPSTYRFTVDVEDDECLVEKVYLFPKRVQAVRFPLSRVEGMYLRRRIWRDPGDVTKVEWAVEMIGPEEEGEIWTLAMGEEREPMAELGRLAAEIAGCSMEEEE